MTVPSVRIDNGGDDFCEKNLQSLSESRDVYVITRPPVCKKESGQSLNRVFTFFCKNIRVNEGSRIFCPIKEQKRKFAIVDRS